MRSAVVLCQMICVETKVIARLC
ncbi:hypothetical protein MESS2_980079 [Mesorhizobium metallidurans STM 2683]|uniref:Uncharacterized protein n=1 Tax=Mesorhizobium metallidurans STM 2683 TaxID=1297569 RepID=M5FBU5_9HYPH|nr:hypothetical protein MESS2_980079 [Mesorhizobium metallidurans STM 2683]